MDMSSPYDAMLALFRVAYQGGQFPDVMQQAERFCDFVLSNRIDNSIFQEKYAPQLEYFIQSIAQLIDERMLAHAPISIKFLKVTKVLCDIPTDNPALYKPRNLKHFLHLVASILRFNVIQNNTENMSTACEVFHAIGMRYDPIFVREVLNPLRGSLILRIAYPENAGPDELYSNHLHMSTEVGFRAQVMKLIVYIDPIVHVPNLAELPWNMQEVYISLCNTYDADTTTFNHLLSLIKTRDTHPLLLCAAIFGLQKFALHTDRVDVDIGMDIAKIMLLLPDKRVARAGLAFYYSLCDKKRAATRDGDTTELQGDILSAMRYSKPSVAEIVKSRNEDHINMILEGPLLLLSTEPSTQNAHEAMSYLMHVLDTICEEELDLTSYGFRNQLFEIMSDYIWYMKRDAIQYVPKLANIAVEVTCQTAEQEPRLMGAAFGSDLLANMITICSPDSITEHILPNTISTIKNMIKETFDFSMTRKNAQLYFTYSLFAVLKRDDMDLLLDMEPKETEKFLITTLVENISLDATEEMHSMCESLVECGYTTISNIIKCVIQPSEVLTKVFVEVHRGTIVEMSRHMLADNSQSVPLGILCARYLALDPFVSYFVTVGAALIDRALSAGVHTAEEYDELVDALYYILHAVADKAPESLQILAHIIQTPSLDFYSLDRERKVKTIVALLKL